MKQRPSLLLVANYASDVGYAWWLMESFWIQLAGHYSKYMDVILAFPRLNKLPSAIKDASIHIVEFNMTGRSPRQVLRQCKFLAQNQVHAIYFSDMASWHWCYILYRLAGVRIIITHDHTPGNRPEATGGKAAIKRLINRLPWLTVDGAIGATDFVRNRFVRVGCMPECKCFSAPNGLPPIDRQMKPVDLHHRFNIPPKKKIAIMTGRAHRYKGVEFALQCMSMYYEKGEKNLQFIFVGDGPDLERFKRKAQMSGCVESCTFPGRCTDIYSLLEGADLAIHPSKGEVGYSLSILEYMRAGLPVIVPDDPSVCGCIKDSRTGIIYPQGNVERATESLRHLVNNDALRKNMAAEAKAVAETYKLEDTHKALLRAFLKIDRHGLLMPSSKKEGL